MENGDADVVVVLVVFSVRNLGLVGLGLGYFVGGVGYSGTVS